MRLVWLSTQAFKLPAVICLPCWLMRRINQKSFHRRNMTSNVSKDHMIQKTNVACSGRIPNWKTEPGNKSQHRRWGGMLCGKVHLVKLISKRTNENISPSNEDEIKFKARLVYSWSDVKNRLVKSVKGLRQKIIWKWEKEKDSVSWSLTC